MTAANAPRERGRDWQLWLHAALPAGVSLIHVRAALLYADANADEFGEAGGETRTEAELQNVRELKEWAW